MKKEEWVYRIRAACQDVGTYRESFDSVIDTLSRIMETRDEAEAQYQASGGKTVVEHTNKGGATNSVKNPALMVVMDCNAQALAYWRDLGLTPAGLRRLNESAMKEPENKDTFTSILENLGA